jgi:hypothetical protein
MASGRADMAFVGVDMASGRADPREVQACLWCGQSREVRTWNPEARTGTSPEACPHRQRPSAPSGS